MEERLKAIMARVKAMFPDKSIIVSPQFRFYNCDDKQTQEWGLYIEDLGESWFYFKTIEALESYVCELEEKHRKENMTDVEKIREFVVNLPSTNVRNQTLDFIDVLTGELPF